MADINTVTVRASARLKKFAPGADPEKDDPIEVIKTEDVLTGDAAREFLANLNRMTNTIPK